MQLQRNILKKAKLNNQCFDYVKFTIEGIYKIVKLTVGHVQQYSIFNLCSMILKFI